MTLTRLQTMRCLGLRHENARKDRERTRELIYLRQSEAYEVWNEAKDSKKWRSGMPQNVDEVVA